MLMLPSCAHRHAANTPRLAELNSKIADTPDDSAVWIDRGYVYCLLGNKRKAWADLTEAIRLKPNDPVLHSRVGWAWFNADEFKLALSAWQTAVRLSKGKNYYDDYVLAVGHWAVGDFVHAAKHYDNAVKRDERFAEWASLVERTETWTQKEKRAIYAVHDLWRKTFKPE